jgi:hypothetical protein
MPPLAEPIEHHIRTHDKLAGVSGQQLLALETREPIALHHLLNQGRRAFGSRPNL